MNLIKMYRNQIKSVVLHLERQSLLFIVT